MEVRSIRKLETRHVNLKPTERSEGGFKFTCRVSNFRIDRYRHSLTDLYTGSFVSLQQTLVQCSDRRDTDWISQIFMSAMSYRKCLFAQHDFWQNYFTCKASKVGDFVCIDWLKKLRIVIPLKGNVLKTSWIIFSYFETLCFFSACNY